MKKLYCCLSLLLALLPSLGIQADNNVVRMLIGTYTEGGTSEGAYVVRFDQVSGTSEVVSSVNVGNPSFIIPSPQGDKAFCVNEYNDGRQAATSFWFQGDRLSLINQVSTQRNHEENGKDPCNIATDGRMLVTSNYSSGDLSVFPLRQDGTIGPMSQYLSFKPHSHIHCLCYSPDGKYAFVTDLGDDCIYRFRVNPEQPETYLSDQTVAYQSPKGAGPRHFIFDTTGRHAYLICELGDLLVSFDYADGKLTPTQTQIAYDGAGGGSADIRISPDGRFLYTSHRLKDDGISIFRIDEQNGMATKVGYWPTVAHPRNINITPNGKYLLAACRDGDVIQVFERNPSTGMLTYMNKDISLSKPVCISFVETNSEIGLQLYSVRSVSGMDASAQKFGQTLRDIRGMGYSYVESANYQDGLFYGLAPLDFKKEVKAEGLEVVSAHADHFLSEREVRDLDFSEALKWWTKCADACKSIGINILVEPSLPFTPAEGVTNPWQLISAKKWSLDKQTALAYCQLYNEIGRMCKAKGMKFAFHNHWLEFGKLSDTEESFFDILLANTDPELVYLELDVYWATTAGADPVKIMKEHPARILTLHIKDEYAIGDSGKMDFPTIFQTAQNTSVQYKFVEIEYAPENLSMMECCKRSIDYVQALSW